MFRISSMSLYYFFLFFSKRCCSKQIRHSYVTQCNATQRGATQQVGKSPLSLPDGAIHHLSMGVIRISRSTIKSLQKNVSRSFLLPIENRNGKRYRDAWSIRDGGRRFVPSRARGRCILIRMPVARFLLRRTIPFIQSYVIYEHVSSPDISLINLPSNIFSTE